MTSTASVDIYTRIQKALEEKGIPSRAYEKYLHREYGKNSTDILITLLCVLQKWKMTRTLPPQPKNYSHEPNMLLVKWFLHITMLLVKWFLHITTNTTL